MKKQAENQNICFSLLSILRGFLSHQLRKKIPNNILQPHPLNMLILIYGGHQVHKFMVDE